VEDEEEMVISVGTAVEGEAAVVERRLARVQQMMSGRKREKKKADEALSGCCRTMAAQRIVR
jgi:hypothetical protein